MAVEESRIRETLPHGDDLPHTRASVWISGVIQRIGALVSWVWLVLLAVIVLNVVLRYVFGEGRIEFEEIQWHLYAVGFLIGLSVCFDTDDHIRVDLLRSRMNPAVRAWIELYGLLLLFVPFVLLVLAYSLPFVAYSFSTGEVSDSAGGLAWRWLIKSALPASFALLLFAAVGRVLRLSAFLFGVPRPLPTPESSVNSNDDR